MSELRPKKFIGPTQGLRTRQGHGLHSNLENIGGRILIQAEMSNHKLRMKSIKSQVNIAPPWGHQHENLRPSSSATHRRPPSAGGGRSSSSLAITQPMNQSSLPVGGAASVARSQRAASSTSMNNNTSASAPTEFDLSKLSPEQQATYRDMLRLLSALSTADSKTVLEQLYRESEDRKLLAAYTGVFPGLEREEAAGGNNNNTSGSNHNNNDSGISADRTPDRTPRSPRPDSA